ncbi:MAG: hypothetical protein ACI4VO_03245 [Clostridia bacterium]
MNSEDMSDVFEKLNNIAGQNNVSPDMVNNLFNMLNNSNVSNNANSPSDSSNSNDSQSSENNTSGIDIETIMRMKTIMDKMNAKDDPRANLLQCLKPYLKESRKSKVDQYIQLMNISKIMEVFPFIGGDKKK